MKALLAGLCLAATGVASRAARAEVCHPPVPETWSDPRVFALYDSGQDSLVQARKLDAGQRRAAAAHAAEVMFREIDRGTCLPATVIALAQSLELQGKYLEAAHEYQRLLDAKPEIAKYRFYAPSLLEAERALPLAFNHTAHITLHLRSRDCAVGNPHTFLDGAATPLDSSVRVNFGEYNARVEALGCTPSRRHFTVDSPADISMVFDLSPPPPHDSPKVLWLGLPPWVVISGGAVLTAGVSVATYALLKPSN
ncbi:MAG TPA: hypothetical protein VHM25_25660, partial [Polyangiaceae bacterium]|nr:hypothetical protein [Polyangiaceae bacterium]